MKFSAETLVWLFAIMGLIRTALILRKQEVSREQYKHWATRIAVILVWLFSIYGFVVLSKIKPLAESLKERNAWVATKLAGFRLREEPELDATLVHDTALSQEITVLNGQRVVILERGLKPDTIDSQTGAWCKIEYNGYKGYCFDRWLLMESDLLDLVQSYISYLGGKNKRKACALQTQWPDCEKFASPAYFGGITETETISSSFKSVAAGEGAALVHVIYRAVDQENDARIKAGAGLLCEKAGIIYEENFLIKRQPDGDLKIADFIRLKSRCPD